MKSKRSPFFTVSRAVHPTSVVFPISASSIQTKIRRLAWLAPIFCAFSASAATWKSNGTNDNWTTNGTDLNWDTGAAWTNGSQAVFGGTDGEAITVSSVTASRITFNNTGTAYSLSGGTITLATAGDPVIDATVDATISSDIILSGAQTWRVAAGKTLTLGNINAAATGTAFGVGGAGSYIFNGSIGSNVGNVLFNSAAGTNTTATFTTANTFAGTLHLGQGGNSTTLNFSDVNQLGTGTGTNWLAIQNGSTLNYTGSGSQAVTNRDLYWNIGAATINVANAGANLTLGATGGARTQNFTKTGDGTLTLNSTATITGGTVTVNGGTLVLKGAHTSTGLTSVTSGTLIVAPTSTGATPTTLLGGSAVVSNNATLKIDFTNVTNGTTYPHVILNGNSGSTTLNAGSTLELYADASHVMGGTAILFDANGASLTGSGTLKKTGAGAVDFFNAGPGSGFTGMIDVEDGVLTFQTGSTAFSGKSALYINTDGTVDIRGGSDNTIAVDALSGTGVIGSSDTGNGGIRTLSVGNNGGSGTFEGQILSTVTGRHGVNGTWTGATMNLVKNGAGIQTLSGTNTYIGTTTVSGGTLLVSGSIGASAVTVNGGVLASGSTGTIGKTVTINNGAILAAGDQGATGTATVTNGTTFNDGSIFSWDITSTGSAYDKLVATGITDGEAAGGSIFRVVADTADAFWNVNRQWTDIFTTNGTNAIANWASVFTTVQTYNSSGNSFTPGNGSFSVSGNTLQWTAVPEPTSALAGLLLGAGLLRRRRAQIRPAATLSEPRFSC